MQNLSILTAIIFYLVGCMPVRIQPPPVWLFVMVFAVLRREEARLSLLRHCSSKKSIPCASVLRRIVVCRNKWRKSAQ